VAQFSFSPQSPLTNEPVTFTSNSSGASSENWDLDGDRTCDDVIGSSVAVRSFPVAGVYKVTLCVSDSVGQSASQTLNVAVSNRPPVAALTYAPLDPQSGESLVLTSISADPDGPLVSQQWDLDGDGAFDDGLGPTAELSSLAAGIHHVALLVSDQNGATAVATADVLVRERPAEPITPFPVVSMLAAVGDRGTRIRELVVHAPAGARIRVRCRGRGCPFRSFARKADVHVYAARIVRIHRLRKHLLRPGTLIEIRVTKRGEVGKFTRFRIRKGKPPKRTDRCLEPGVKRPARCR
jgi:PKD repeat protein